MTNHDAGAGPGHGPAHRGDLGSAEPGGFDEYDHQATGADADADAATAAVADAAEEGTLTEPAGGEMPPPVGEDEPIPAAGSTPTGEPTRSGEPTRAGETPTAPPGGRPVVSDGTAGEGDGTEASEPAYGLSESADARLAAERLEDLRRLQAEYVNYKKRVDRDRDRAREAGISYTLEALLPVLDDIHWAREHGELQEGPFAAIAEKLESVLERLGIKRFGSAGEEFDPVHHEALMHVEAELDPGATSTTIVQVLQPGYRLGDRVVRAARVAVADPQ